MMLALGLFVFELRTLPFQEMQRAMSWRHAEQSRVGERPALQFTGPDADTITLTGVLHPELTGGRLSIDMLETMADQGEALPLVEGSGWIHGMFVVESLQTTRTLFFDDGAARRIEFSISLKRADVPLGLMIDQAQSVADTLLDKLGTVIGADLIDGFGGLTDLAERVGLTLPTLPDLTDLQLPPLPDLSAMGDLITAVATFPDLTALGLPNLAQFEDLASMPAPELRNILDLLVRPA
ncbi:phage tail protein [Methyloversatilis sp.]|uniref:phage tail protein n=1 Tax=Methyloversatilis sp. TaxID=2569862 RepID=UPI0027350541|nr:phage tail protein [Methyloversatilis sp.]MDP3579127.1 phage tail protein [Methyloversatilis sp.]